MQVQRADVPCRALDARDIACAAAQVRVNDVGPPLLDDLGESVLRAPPRRHLEHLDAGLEFVEQADARVDRGDRCGRRARRRAVATAPHTLPPPHAPSPRIRARE